METLSRRYLLAIDLDLEVCERLATVQQQLTPVIRDHLQADLRWIHPERLLMVLKIFEDIDRNRAISALQMLRKPLASFRPFRFALHTLGAYPKPQKPRLIYTRVFEGLDTLKALHDTVQNTLLEGGFRQDLWKPWVLLGRIKTLDHPIDLSPIRQAMESIDFGRTKVRDLALYESYGQFQNLGLHVVGRVHLQGVIKRLHLRQNRPE